MVKDDLTAFQKVYGIYNKSSRCKAIKKFFSGVPNPVIYWFSFASVTLILLASVIVGILFTFAGDTQKDEVLFSIIGLLSTVTIFYFVLLKRYGISKRRYLPYRDVLTYTFYQCERYLMFKDELTKEAEIPLRLVKELIQSRLQLDQGLKVFGVWLLGIAMSLVITVIYSFAPSCEQEKTAYVIIVTFYLLLTLLFVYSMHDPYWFKANKYRELLLFITIYESDVVTEDRT